MHLNSRLRVHFYELQVSGFSKRVEGEAWVPVQIPSEAGEKKGWIKTSTIELTEGDMAHNPQMKNRGEPSSDSTSVTRHVVNFWGSAGIADVHSSSKDRAGFRAALGADFVLGQERRFFVGPEFSRVTSREALEGGISGQINRTSIFSLNLAYRFMF
ncbi:MAG: hypothetical protein H7222_14985 [Methylotenera sp.]|nr:hypothetical protein [Oligoflexia bacterium]